MATYLNAIIIYLKSNIILNINSDASYIDEKVWSIIGGRYFLGSIPRKIDPININGAIHTIFIIIKYIVISASEAELEGLFNTSRIGKIIHLALIELGHPQPLTPLYTDNYTAAVIINHTVKQWRSLAMDIHYFCIVDQVHQYIFVVKWAPGLENVGDCHTKHTYVIPLYFY